MKIFRKTPDFDFIGFRTKAFLISGLLLGASAAVLATKGLNWGIDFTGGSVVQITYDEPQELPTLRSELARAGFGDAIPQHFTGTQTFAIRIKGVPENASAEGNKLIEALRTAAPGKAFRVDQRDFVGPTVGAHLYKQAIFAIVFSLLGIVGYVAFRFANPLWGLAGIVALAHDVFVTLGLFSVLGIELNLVLVAGILTVAGYSINDSIVIFDRMREKMRLMRRDPLKSVINLAVNETLSRTLITSLTTFFTAATLFVLGGPVIHDFALTLAFGVLIGTYSSVAIAAPVVFHWAKSETQAVPAEPRPGPQAESFRPSEGGGGRRERRKRRHQ